MKGFVGSGKTHGMSTLGKITDFRISQDGGKMVGKKIMENGVFFDQFLTMFGRRLSAGCVGQNGAGRCLGELLLLPSRIDF